MSRTAPAPADHPLALDIDPERLAHVQACVADIRQGKMVVLVDDEDRENEGDLVLAAECVSPDAINFMAKHGRGLICLALTEEQVAKLELPMMTLPQWRGGPALGTAFTLSIEARDGVTTGISAADRAHTIRVAIGDRAGPESIVTPGHVFPLKARRGGVLVRTGQTEGSVDLARLAGLEPAGVICEIMNDDGSMARMPDLEQFAQEHSLKILTIADLIRYRLQTERLVQQKSSELVHLDTGRPWQLSIFDVAIDSREFLTLRYGEPQDPVLCRMHRGSLIGDLFCATESEGGRNLREAVRRIEAAGSGLIVYLPSTQTLTQELAAVHGSPQKSVPSDQVGDAAGSPRGALREFGLGAQILRELGICKIRLLTDNPRKIAGIRGYGLEVVESLPLSPTAP